MLVEKYGLKLNPWVFGPSAGLILALVALGVAFPRRVGEAAAALQKFIIETFGWFYIASVGFFLFFIVWLMFSRYGDVRLGPDDSRPDYRFGSWLAMLFSAGMGIGILFFSVAEPIMHFSSPPVGEPGSIDAARRAMHLTFFHWGLHAWAIYAVVGLSLAYFTYRHNLPLTIRSAFYPLFGERIYGPIGNMVDTFAVFGTMFGLATSLGLGAMQVNTGLAHLGLMPVSTTNQLILIASITLIATASVIAGLERGIKFLSEINMYLGLGLVLAVFLLGPTIFLLSSLVQSIGYYLQNLVGTTFRTDAFIGTEWQSSWTMFYWAWWIAWSPFVGMFIARISRGRTIQEFIAGVLLTPTLLTFVWLVVLGNTAVHIELFGGGGIAAAVKENVPVALFVMLEKLPLSTLTSLIAVVVIATFFVTSSDSGSLVIDILTADGALDAPVVQRVFWAFTQGGVAAALLLSGGLSALQTAAIVTALPFCAVMLLMCYSLVKGLREELRPLPRDLKEDG
jgi:choline/glycine/proline betaine transport protein